MQANRVAFFVQTRHTRLICSAMLRLPLCAAASACAVSWCWRSSSAAYICSRTGPYLHSKPASLIYQIGPTFRLHFSGVLITEI